MDFDQFLSDSGLREEPMSVRLKMRKAFEAASAAPPAPVSRADESELLAAARQYYNATIAQPSVRISSTIEKLRDEAAVAGDRLRAAIEATQSAPNKGGSEPVAEVQGSDRVIGAERRSLAWMKGIDSFSFAPGTKLYAAPQPVAPPAALSETVLLPADTTDYKAMFEDACLDLAAIHTALGIPDDEAGGAEPILLAIEELRASAPPAALTDVVRDALGSIVRCDPSLLIAPIAEDTNYDAAMLKRVFEIAKERAGAILAASQAGKKGESHE